jgi:hypothetical protein
MDPNNPPTPTPPQADPPSQPQPEPPQSDSEVETLRAQLAKAQARQAELEQAEQARRDASLSEVERAKKAATEAANEANTLRSQLQEQAMRHAFALQAQQLSCLDPDLAFQAIDRSAISYDPATGKVVGVDKALRALAASKPYLFGARPGNGAGNPGGSVAGHSFSPAQIRTMSDADFAKLRAGVRSGQIKL